MPGNSFGKIFCITTFGESHGPAIGVVIDGCPSNFQLNLEHIQQQLDRRKPGQSKITSARKESDTFEIISGLFEGKTTGHPITFLIRNEDAQSKDYEYLKDTFRPSHADYTYTQKYGIRDYRGGGRSSARETASRVIAGAVAQQFLTQSGLSIHAYVSQVGKISLNKNYDELDLNSIDNNIVHCPDESIANKMIDYISDLKTKGDTCGGVISCVVQNVPVGLGEPVFDKLHSDLAKAMMSINAVHGFEYGSGFAGAEMRGSEHNDIFIADENSENKIKSTTNNSGGIQGGISNGMDIYFRVAFKPVATILQSQQTVNSQGEGVTLQNRGRHDPCVVPRAVPIVEAMCAIVLFDHFLRNKLVKWGE
ncbi:MAG: chorismate synthase [Bacteroidia bacterium]